MIPCKMFVNRFKCIPLCRWVE